MIGGGTLRGQLTPDGGVLLEGGLGLVEPVYVPVENPQAIERLREIGSVGGRVLRRTAPLLLQQLSTNSSLG